MVPPFLLPSFQRPSRPAASIPSVPSDDHFAKWSLGLHPSCSLTYLRRPLWLIFRNRPRHPIVSEFCLPVAGPVLRSASAHFFPPGLVCFSDRPVSDSGS